MKNFKLRKTLSLALCMLMLFGMFPVSALAEGESTEPPAQTGQQTQQPNPPADTQQQSTECQHTGGSATCTAQAVCELCGKSYGEPAAHTGGAASCTEAGVCTVCSAAYIEAAGHSYENGVCALCGEADPDYKAPCKHSYGEDGVCTLCGEAKPAEGAVLKSTAPRLTSAAGSTITTLTIDINVPTRSYNASAEVDLNGSLSGLPEGYTYYIGGSLTGTLESADVGTHKLVSIDTSSISIYDENGSLVTDRFSFSFDPNTTGTIIARDVIIDGFTAYPKTYDGTTAAQVPTHFFRTYSFDGFRLEFKFTVTNAVYSDAEIGENKVFTVPADNYYVYYNNMTVPSTNFTIWGTGSITGKELSYSGSGTATGTYGQTLGEFTVDATNITVTEKDSGNAVSGKWVPVDGSAKPEPGESSYEFTFVADDSSKGYACPTMYFTVKTDFGTEKYPLTYTGFTVIDKEFDNSADVWLDLTNARLEGLPSGFAAWPPAAARGTLESADAGTHELTAVDATIWIYDLSTNVEVTDKFDISIDTTGITGTIRPVEIHHDGFIARPKTYNGSTAMIFDFDGGNIEHNTFSISFNTYAGTYDTADAGDDKTFTVDPECYTVNNGAVASTNFILTGSGSITPASLNMEVGSSISGEYGDKLSELDFSDLKCIYDLNTEVPGTWTIAEGQEDITLYTLGTTTETFGFIFTPDSPNYSSKTILYSVTIAPRKVDVSIVGNTETLTYDGKEHSVTGYTLSYDDSVLKDEYIVFSGEAGTATGKNAGTYTAAETLSAEDFSCSSENFDLSFTVANQTSLTISKAPLTITANDLFADEIYENKWTINWVERCSCRYEGFVNGEDESVLTVEPTFNVEITSDFEWHGDTVPIEVSDAEAANYEITHVNGTLTNIVHSHKDTFETDGLSIIATCYNDDGYCFKPVRRATLSAVDVYYTGEPANAVTVEKETGIGRADIRYTGTEGTDYDSAEAPPDVGRYTVTMTVNDATNSEASVSTQFSILPKDIAKCSVELPVSEFTYSGSAPDMNISIVDNSVGSKTLTAGVDYELGAMQKDAGEYSLTVKGIGNYTGTVELDYSIIPFELNNTNITLEVSDKAYTGAELSGVDSIVDGTGMDIDDTGYTLTGGTGTAVGTYTAKLEGKGNFSGSVEATWKISPPAIIDELLAGDSFTLDHIDELKLLEEALSTVTDETVASDAEKEQWEDAAAMLPDLIDTLENMDALLDSDEIAAVEDIDADNVKLEDKAALEAAKEDLEELLNHADVLGLETEFELRGMLQTVNDALAEINKAEPIVSDIERWLKDNEDKFDADELGLREDYESIMEDLEALDTNTRRIVEDALGEKLDEAKEKLFTYRIITGNGATWIKGSSATLDLTANGHVSLFKSLLVDGKALDAKNYTLVSGSTIVKLKADYLQNLESGRHTVQFVYDDGHTDTGSFTVAYAWSSPKTGDSSNPGLWTGLMLMSMLGMAAALPRLKRRKD